MYKEILEKYHVEQSTALTTKILTYEVGNINKIDCYIERFGSAGYLGERRIEISDALTMICLLAEQYNLSIDDLKQEGFERFEHRIFEVKSKLKRTI
jgi:hypothetical protein